MKKQKKKAIIDRLNEHNEDIDALKDWSEESHSRIKAINTDIISLNNKINNNLKDVNSALAQIEERLNFNNPFKKPTGIQEESPLPKYMESPSPPIYNKESPSPQPGYHKSKNGIELRPGTPVLILDYAEMYFVAGKCDNRGFIPVKRVIRRGFDEYETLQITTITMNLKPEDIEVLEI